MDPGRNVDFELALLDDRPGAVTDLARMLGDSAAPAAIGAGGRPDELSEDAARDLLEAAGAVAALAGHDLGSGLAPSPPHVPHVTAVSSGTVIFAPRAASTRSIVNLGSDIAPRGPSRRRAPPKRSSPKNVAEEVTEVAEIEVGRGEAA